MRRTVSGLVMLALGSLALAQPFQWPEEYAATSMQGGEIQEPLFSDFTTLNPVLSANAQEIAVIGLYGSPGLVYRDWLGTRSFRNEAGEYNLFWAADIEEVQEEQEFIITLKEGWQWSDGTEMTADDLVAGRMIYGDPDVGANGFICSVVDEDPVTVEKLDTYQIRVLLPRPQVNALATKVCGAVPAHIFMPVYEEQGAEGILGLWSVDTPLDQIVSGGPYRIAEYATGERIVLEKNPSYGEFVQAADGTPMPGPDRYVVTIAEDANAILSLVVTGQSSFYYPDNLDRVRAVQEAVQSGAIGGEFFPNIGPTASTDFFFYNFNNTDECKQTMFRDSSFRRAISLMMDREAMVQASVGGLGFAAFDPTNEASAPFVTGLEPGSFDPEEGVRLLNSIGFSEEGPDGVLRNPETGCRVAFDMQYNSGNTRRAQLALVASQTAAEYGVQINPIEVSVEVWGDSWDGNNLPRAHDFDAQIGGLVGGDVDNPSGINVYRIASNLNGWNKDRASAQVWEVLMDRLSVQMNDTLDLDERIAVFQRRAEIIRNELPLTPLVSTALHFYHDTSNIWPVESLDANSIQSPYRPGNYKENLMTP